MFRLKLLNQVRMAYVPAVIAGAVATATVVSTSVTNVVLAAKPAPPPPPPPPPTDCDPNKPLVRAKDLPIYYQPDGKIQKEEKPCKEEADLFPDDQLMGLVKAGRQGLWQATDQLNEFKGLAAEFVSTGVEHFNSSLEQLRMPDNENARYGAIAGGGLVGFIFALRGGIMKKIVYTSTGALAMAALCYPEEAETYSSQILEYGSIALHFFNAATKDLVGVEFRVPEFSKLVSIERLTGWIGSSNSSEVSKTSPPSVVLLPPSAETPSHVVPLTTAPSHSQQSGFVPMPPIDRPTSTSQGIKAIPLRDQSDPNDQDMYSLRG